ncbi:unnamed protein product [Adineta ricciae]|uniref:Uncharacterized protein n=1 Tax=Adineta ricciae TaxID=249248 RepID=A0A813PNY4_ADIRI|nr:unnamed protein product [Adineta ricciae]
MCSERDLSSQSSALSSYLQTTTTTTTTFLLICSSHLDHLFSICDVDRLLSRHTCKQDNAALFRVSYSVIRTEQLNRCLDELNIIVNEAKEIERKAQIIEEYIKDTTTIDSLYLNVAMEMGDTQSTEPSSEWHVRFLAQPNIRKKVLINLLWEAHNAMLHLANSIDEVRSPKVVYEKTSDRVLGEIQKELKYKMVCRYRNILNVYVERLEPVFETKDRIEFSRISRVSRSGLHDVRSLVMVRYIQKWMKLLDDVVQQLERKLTG